MLTLRNISFIHANNDLLFDSVNLTVNQYDKLALIGNNGSGKSTLLKIIAKELTPMAGHMTCEVIPYYIPQLFGQFNHLTVAQALQIEDKLNALNQILTGNVNEENFLLLQDDWTIEDRCRNALQHWGLDNVDLHQPMNSLSGGEKTKVFLAGITVHTPDFILLDEPTNHLDSTGRQLLYHFIETTSSTLMVVSHDRKLLNLLNPVCELNKHGITRYGGNYDFYAEQKQAEQAALQHHLQNQEQALRKAKEIERETVARQQKLNARGKKKHEKAGMGKLMLNTLRNKAENSTTKIKTVHTEKINSITHVVQTLRSTLYNRDKMKFNFSDTELHRGKILFEADNMIYSYASKTIWQHDQPVQIVSGERIAIKGNNGSGKTTMIKLISGIIKPQTDTVYRSDHSALYIDQDYTLINNSLSVYEQAQQYNTDALHEHELKIRLNRFLFLQEDWNKPCQQLSGGEKMRLMLCCMTLQHHQPDCIALDEPTNNLDIQSIEILTNAINNYHGTLLVISHDETFLEQININRIIQL